MKRPFAVIGFSMFLVSILITNLKAATVIFIMAIAAFSLFLLVKPLRKYKAVIFSSFAITIYVLAFVVAEVDYTKAVDKFSEPTEIKGVVCQTPTQTDYTYNYVIRLEDENFKIRYYG